MTKILLTLAEIACIFVIRNRNKGKENGKRKNSTLFCGHCWLDIRISIKTD